MDNGNDILDDIGLMATLQRLRVANLLGEKDEATLVALFKTDWGRMVYDAWRANRLPKSTIALLSRFTNAFSQDEMGV